MIIMFKTQVYLEDGSINNLELIGKSKGLSKAQMIRDAVDSYITVNLTQTKQQKLLSLYGAFENNDTDFDALRKDFDR